MSVEIRPAQKEDAATILHFINELATYVREPDVVLNTVEAIETHLFGDNVHAYALICEKEGEAIGFAVYFFNYSTWVGRYGLYLEDLYVSPEYRGTGAGKAIIRYLAQIAVSQQCGRFEWVVLDWNQKAKDFYRRIGALPQDDLTICRLSGEALLQFAESN
ncbi:GNAT family N-acetyltransferase [Vibrio aerogenes]|nr:GNAT family N-acetyltransferase [Vibrio aerogenes]